MSTLHKRVHSGHKAREILENEEFLASFQAIEQEIMNQWTNSPARDAEGREKCWQYLMMLRRVKAQLTEVVETGMLAKLEVDHLETSKARGKISSAG